jgi:carboxypeptidase Q
MSTATAPSIMRTLAATAAFAAFATATPLHGQSAVDTVGAGQLIAQAMNRSEVMQNLQHLGDVIGPRLSGSPAMRRANEWTATQFKSYGLITALEPYTFGVTWERGLATLRLEAPFSREITAHSWAWTQGTGGKTLSGPVVLTDLSTPESLAVYRNRVKGAWVLPRAPFPTWNPDGPPMTAADSADLQAQIKFRSTAVPDRSALHPEGRRGARHPHRWRQGPWPHDHERLTDPGRAIAQPGDLA